MEMFQIFFNNNKEIILAVIAPFFTLIGTFAGAFITQYFLRKVNADNHLFKLKEKEIDENKEARERKEKFIIEAYKILREIERNFSQITILIIRQNEYVTLNEYSQKYISSCEKFDELIAICSLYFPSVAEIIHPIYGNMNLFWGYATQIIHAEKEGKPYEDYKNYYQSVLDASNKIADSCWSAQKALIKESSKLMNHSLQ